MSKLSKTDLKRPDEVWQASASAVGWLQSQWVLLTIVAALAVGGVIGGAYYLQTQLDVEANAQFAYGEAARLFEQWKAAEKEAKIETEAKLLDSLKKLSADHAKSRANAYADLLRAQLAIEKSNWADAEGLLKSFERALPKQRKSIALYPLGGVYEEQGKWTEAADAYKKILDSKDPSYRKWAFLGRGRSLRELQKVSEAQTVYDDFIKEYPKSPEIQKVRGYMNLLSTSKP